MEEIVYCPWCKIPIEVIELNCAIFRCGYYKNSFTQIMPHLSQQECDKLLDKIYGCGKPFRIMNGKIEKCEYI